MFWGITNCGLSSWPAPNGHTFTLEQQIGNVCTWAFLGSAYHVFWEAKIVGAPLSKLRLMDSDGLSFFNSVSLQCPLEYWTYSNNQAACILFYAGAGGFGRIWWNQKVSFDIDGFGLDCGPELLAEMFTAPGSHIVNKYCDLNQRTNIRILHDYP